MKNFTLYLFVLLFWGTVSAQDYNTPNTGVHWTLDSIVEHNPATVTGANGVFTVNRDFTLSENDTLIFSPGDSIKIDEDIRLTIGGSLFSEGTDNNSIVITAVDSLTPYDGLRFEDTSTASFDYSIIKNGGGLKVLTPDFTLTNSLLAYNVSGVATGAAVSISYGSPLIENNQFIKNDLPAIASPANYEVSAQIIDNYLEKNGQANENRPQINMGTTGADTLKIIGNTIIGDRSKDMVGGIAAANLVGSGQVNVRIENNTITDNRYGINVFGGNSFALIIGNTIEDNDTQGSPASGGSGIALNSGSDSQTVIATDNAIRRNLWGITIQNEGSINLGDDEDNPGNNVFSENGNNGETYALYNNTANTIYAKHNCWIEGQENTLADAASVIFDQADDASLGEVIYDPVGCGDMSVREVDQHQLALSPNPAHGQIQFNNAQGFNRVSVFDLNGREVLQKPLQPDQTDLSFELDAGLYIIQFQNNAQTARQKLIVR